MFTCDLLAVRVWTRINCLHVGRAVRNMRAECNIILIADQSFHPRYQRQFCMEGLNGCGTLQQHPHWIDIILILWNISPLSSITKCFKRRLMVVGRHTLRSCAYTAVCMCMCVWLVCTWSRPDQQLSSCLFPGSAGNEPASHLSKRPNPPSRHKHICTCGVARSRPGGWYLLEGQHASKLSTTLQCHIWCNKACLKCG